MRIDVFKENLRKIVTTRKRHICTNPNNHVSAVLVPLYISDEKSENDAVKSVSVVFIRRSFELANHAGNVAFPGGHKDPEDLDLFETAVREAHEEIALKRENIEIVGMLDDEETITSNFVITPVLAFINQSEFKAQEEEVSEIFTVPLEHLLNPQNNSPAFYEHEGNRFQLTDFFFEGRKIWGATSRILEKLLELIETALKS